MLKIFFLFIFSLNTYAGTVLLAKGRSIIISTQDLKNDHVGSKVFIINDETIVATGYIKKIVKEDVKSLVILDKGQTEVGQKVFMSPEEAFDWIKTGGKSEFDQYIPDFLKKKNEDEVATDDEEYIDETEDSTAEDEPEVVDKKEKKDRNYFLEAHAGLGMNGDGIFYRFGGSFSIEPDDSSFYYLILADYSMVNAEIDSFSLGGGVSTMEENGLYSVIQGAVGLGYKLTQSWRVEGILGGIYYTSSFNLTTNNAQSADFSSTSLGLYAGPRLVYKLTWRSFDLLITVGLNFLMGNSTNQISYNGSTTETESSFSDREYYGQIGLGWGF